MNRTQYIIFGIALLISSSIFDYLIYLTHQSVILIGTIPTIDAVSLTLIWNRIWFFVAISTLSSILGIACILSAKYEKR